MGVHASRQTLSLYKSDAFEFSSRPVGLREDSSVKANVK